MLKTIIFITLTFLLFTGCDSNNSTQIDTSIDNQATDETPIHTETDTNEILIHQKSLPMLGILISYNNIQISSSPTTWSKKLFGKNEHELNHYYLQNSNNMFEFEPARESYNVVDDGIVSIKLNKNHPDIDIDSFLFGDKVYPDLKQALMTADSVVDFSNYDTNADGSITPDELILTFIVAGYEDAYEGVHVQNGIWAHESCLYDSSLIPQLDGVTLMDCSVNGSFALFGEKHDRFNPHNATIGIIAHELGHSTFDLPDLYNTSNPNKGGIGFFGLMGAGTWATQNSTEYFGNTPTHFSAWSKIFNGWITPTIESSNSATLYESASNEYNIIKIPINSTSYYLLENRNNSGYDRGLYSLTGQFLGGMAIWKIDETKLTQSNIDLNNVNADTNNKGVDLVEAVNGIIDRYADGGDENALYYQGNVDYFSTYATDISTRGSAMSLNIR